jgi:adenylate cyclase
MSTSPPTLASIARCFQGVVPSVVCTTDRDGVPNVIYVSQVYRVDGRRVALSRQFFSKTTRNLEATGRAAVEVLDPLSLEAYRLRLRFVGSETSGPLFDTMALRIQAIASHTGMSGIFRLIAADVFEVERLQRVEGSRNGASAAGPGDEVSAEGLRTELRGLQWVSDRINRSPDLDSLLDAVLEALDTFFGFRHAMVLLAEEPGGRLVTMASRGYGDAGVGAEVASGDGLIGTVARERRVLRMSGIDQGLSYGRAVRREVLSTGGGAALAAEIPLPGLPDARSALVIPLAVRDRLLGVLATESREPMAFDEWHEAYLEVLGNQIALGLERLIDATSAEEKDETTGPAPRLSASPRDARAAGAARKRSFCYYRNDDCVFVDGEYLIRNVPGRILWKLLGQWSREGRTEFTNRELRLDPALGLPGFRDNLESRLVLLRRRLEEKCPDVRLVRTGRGRFALAVEAAVELLEKESA